MHSISTWLLRISNRLSGSESVVSCTQQLQDKLSVTTMAADSKSPTFPMFVRWSLKQILKRIFYADGLTHTIWKALLLVNANNEVLLPKSNACMNWIERKVLLSQWDWANNPGTLIGQWFLKQWFNWLTGLCYAILHEIPLRPLPGYQYSIHF